MQELDNSLFHPQTKIFVNIMYLSFTFLPLDPILFQFFLGLCSIYYLLSGFQPLPPFSTFPHILYTCSRLTPKLNLYHHLRLPAQLLSFSSQPSSLKDQSSVTISTTSHLLPIHCSMYAPFLTYTIHLSNSSDK